MDAKLWQSFHDPGMVLLKMGTGKARRIDVDDKVVARRLRLFVCACARHIEHALEPHELFAVGVAEDHAEGKLTARQMRRERDLVLSGSYSSIAWNLLRPSAVGAARFGSLSLARRELDDDINRKYADVRHDQADLLRHTFHLVHLNGSRLPLDDLDWTSTVTDLATALYSGEDCQLILRDALLDCGQDALADHFTNDRHPKCCWALNCILKK